VPGLRGTSYYLWYRYVGVIENNVNNLPYRRICTAKYIPWADFDVRSVRHTAVAEGQLF
jgi:hypothetical protein